MHWNYFIEKYQKSPVEHYRHKVAENVLVSVLVQTYNHEAYIKNCLDSILTQKTNFSFEILLGEDDSSDNTRNICIEYAHMYPEKIRLFLHHPSNKIKVSNLTTGNFNAFYNFYRTRGKYIAFCEGDDFWTDPLKLQKQFDHLKTHPHNSFSFHRFTEHFVNNQESRNLLNQPEENLIPNEIKKLKAHPLLSTICFRKSFTELPEEMIKVLNVDSFLISILGSIGSGHFHPDINPTVYNRHTGGIWSDLQRKNQIELKILTDKYLILFYFKKMHITTSFYFFKQLFKHFVTLKKLK